MIIHTHAPQKVQKPAPKPKPKKEEVKKEPLIKKEEEPAVKKG